MLNFRALGSELCNDLSVQCLDFIAPSTLSLLHETLKCQLAESFETIVLGQYAVIREMSDQAT